MVSPLFITFDIKKASSNELKHGVTFAEAVTVFRDPQAVTIPDEVHSNEENRELTLGYSDRHRILMVVHTKEVDKRLRIVSARKATRHEQRAYEER